MSQLPIHSCRHRQQGAALVVGLVILLVMTMIGVSSMGSMTTELRIATNIQTHQVAFQAAAGGLQNVLRDNAIVWNDYADGVGTLITTQPGVYGTASDGQVATMEIKFAGCKKNALGESISGGSSSGGSSVFLIHEIAVTGEAYDSTGADVIGTSRQVLGIKSVRSPASDYCDQ